MNNITIIDDFSLEMVDGGISTKNAVIIGIATAVCPLLGVCMMVGYFINK